MAELFAAEVIAAAAHPKLVRGPKAQACWLVFSYTSQDDRWRLEPTIFSAPEKAEEFGRSLTAYWSHYCVVKVMLPGRLPPTAESQPQSP